MELFLTDIHINKIYHNQDISIPVSKTEKKHLIITGKNGCGKTTLLQAMADFLQKIKNDPTLSFYNHSKNIQSYEQYIKNTREYISAHPDDCEAQKREINQYSSALEYYNKEYNNVFGKVELFFNDISETAVKASSGDFLFAFYEATRKSRMNVPDNPQKPNLQTTYNIKERKIEEFLYFLVDLKVQEALARNENHISEADEIKEWFVNFTQILARIFNDEGLTLKFNFKNYHFSIILSDGREFGFNELSDGYSAILDIVADLIVKMQNPESVTRAYQKQGIVLIDEIETHLHLELQRLILPVLTTIFPNIQFIVTTHSPFILNSLPDAVAFDLERKETLDDLTEYSYESLVNGYFGVSSESSYLQIKLNDFRKLAEKTGLDAEELSRLKALDKEFSELPDAAAPQIKGEYYQIKLQQNTKR